MIGPPNLAPYATGQRQLGSKAHWRRSGLMGGSHTRSVQRVLPSWDHADVAAHGASELSLAAGCDTLDSCTESRHKKFQPNGSIVVGGDHQHKTLEKLPGFIETPCPGTAEVRETLRLAYWWSTPGTNKAVEKLRPFSAGCLLRSANRSGICVRAISMTELAATSTLAPPTHRKGDRK